MTLHLRQFGTVPAKDAPASARELYMFRGLRRVHRGVTATALHAGVRAAAGKVGWTVEVGCPVITDQQPHRHATSGGLGVLDQRAPHDLHFTSPDVARTMAFDRDLLG